MTLAHEIYIDQLALLLGGCPLWGSLHPQEDPVDIGDVGYLSDNGGWVKLFNLRTETDPKDLPPNHQPGSLVITDRDINKDIFKGPQHSNSVQSLGGNVGIEGKAEAGFSYECTEEKGAILFVAEDAVARDALNKSVFVKLIRDNIHDWVKFAAQKGRIIKMNDLALVTGYVRTTTWAAAVFARRSQSCKFTVGGAIPAADTGAKLQLWGSIHNVSGFWTGGPEDRMQTGNSLDTRHFLKHTAPGISPPGLLCKDDPRHQCVLVRGYRMEGRDWWERLPFKKKKQLKGIEVLSPQRTHRNDDPTSTPTLETGITNNAPTAGTTTAILNESEIPEAGPSINDPNTDLISDPSSRGHSSNRRGRRRRGQRQGNDSDRGLNHGNRRRDGGAGGAGAGPSTGGNLVSFNAGRQSGSASGGTANSGGQPTGTQGSTNQQTSRNAGDAAELDDLFYQWGQSSGSRSPVQKTDDIGLLIPEPSGTRSSVQKTDDIGLPTPRHSRNRIIKRKNKIAVLNPEPSRSPVHSEPDLLLSDEEDSIEVDLSPWEVFLEYLLRTEEKADYAIVHDDDFSVLPIKSKSVSELEAQLQVANPQIYLNGSIAMLKPTALEFFRSTGYFYQTDTEGRIGYFSQSVLFHSDPSDSHVHTFSGYRENPEILFAALKKIHIHAKTYIHSIQCEYQGPENKTILGNKHGNSGDAPLYTFELDSDECITKVRGRSGECIDQLQFVTNKGRMSPLYGGSGGNLFIWTLDEERYPNSPGLHHFEGIFGKYIQTLQASIPIYPWFEDSRRTMVQESDYIDLYLIALGAGSAIEEICGVVTGDHKHIAETTQCIRADTFFKLLRETESRYIISRNLTNILEMLEHQEQAAVNCGLIMITELARLGEFEMKNLLQITFVRELLVDKKRFLLLLQKISGTFKDEMMSLLPGLIDLLLTDSNQSVKLNASVIIGYLSEQSNFHTSIQGVIEGNRLIELLGNEAYLVRSTSITLLAKLSEQIRSQPFIIDAFPSIMHLLKDNISYVRMTTADAIGKFAEQEGLQPVIREHITEIIQNLLELMKNRTYKQSSGRNAIIKLSQRDDFREEILTKLPDLLGLLKNESLSVRENAITLLAHLADHAGMTTEILYMLRPDIVTPSTSYSPSIWVSVLAASSTLLDQLKIDGNIDYYVSQLLVGMSVDKDGDVRDKSAEIVVKILRYVKKPSVVHTLIDLTRNSSISSCKLNGVNALLTVLGEEQYQNDIYTVIRDTIPDLVDMLRSDSDRERARVVTILREIGERSEFRRNVGEIVLEIIRLFKRNPRSPAIPPGIELLTAFLKDTEIQRDITENLDFKFLSTLLHDTDKSLVLAGLSLALDILSMNETIPLQGLPAMPALMVAPGHIRAALTLGDSSTNHKGIMVLLSLFRLGYKDEVLAMVKGIIFHIADSSKVDSIRDPFLPKLHIDGWDKLLGQLSEQAEFQSVILEAIPMFVMAARLPGNDSAYNILKLLSVRRELQSAIQLAIPPVVEKIESNTEYLKPCLDLLWTLSEQAAYRSAIMPFAYRLVSMMRDNTRPDVQVTMAGILMNMPALPSDIMTRRRHLVPLEALQRASVRKISSNLARRKS